MGKFSKLADDVLGNDWRSRLGEQENRLRKYIPTSRDEALSKAKSILKQLQEKAYMAGVEAHLANREAQPQIPIMKPTMSGVPGRQVTISSGEPKILPESKIDSQLMKKELKAAGVLDMAMNPAIELWEDAKSNLAKRLDATRLSAMQTTADPGTIPWFYPSVASSVPKSFMRGYRETDKALDEEQARKMTEELESAKLDFEKSLAEEYASSRPKTAGELIDGLAQAHVKQAEGELNQAFGVYLALATLLGGGTHEFAKNWVEKRDPKRQEYKALRNAVLRRMQSKPIQIQAAPPVLEPIELDV